MLFVLMSIALCALMKVLTNLLSSAELEKQSQSGLQGLVCHSILKILNWFLVQMLISVFTF